MQRDIEITIAPEEINHEQTVIHKPVSYTHLDVYKRQIFINVNSNL